MATARREAWVLAPVLVVALAAGCAFSPASSAPAVSVKTSPAAERALPPSVAPFVHDVAFAVAMPANLPSGLSKEPSATVIGTRTSPLVTHALVLTYAPSGAGGPSLEISESELNESPSGGGLTPVTVGGHRAEIRALAGKAPVPPLALWVRAHGVSFTLLSQNLSRAALVRIAQSLVN